MGWTSQDRGLDFGEWQFDLYSLPMLIQTGVVTGTAKRTPKWTLHDGKGNRSWSFSVVFPESFNEAPKVFLAVRLLDAVNKKGADFRFAVEPRFITDSSFSVVTSTWSDSQIWSLHVTWIAIDSRFAAQPGSLIQLGVEKFHKNDHGYTLDSGKGERQITRRIQFGTRYAGTPQVFTGFAMLDVTNGTGNDFRVESLAVDADEYGFDVGAKTCVNSKVWSTQISWIAIDPRLLRGLPQDDILVYGSKDKFAVHNAGYSLHRGEGARQFDKNVQFLPPFAAPPAVATFLTAFDILLTTEAENEAGSDNENGEVDDEEIGLPAGTLAIDARVVASDENRSRFGFTLRTATWGDARIWSATSTWIAIGSPQQAVAPHREPEEEEDDEENGDEEEEEEEFSEETAEAVREARAAAEHDPDYLEPRKNGIKRQLSIPIIAPADEEEEAAPAAKKAKLTEGADVPKAEVSEDRECKVCMDNPINTVLIPCGHQALCMDCVTLLRANGNKACPICKKETVQVVKTYLA